MTMEREKEKIPCLEQLAPADSQKLRISFEKQDEWRLEFVTCKGCGFGVHMLFTTGKGDSYEALVDATLKEKEALLCTEVWQIVEQGEELAGLIDMGARLDWGERCRLLRDFLACIANG